MKLLSSAEPSENDVLPDFKYEELPDQSSYLRLLEVLPLEHGRSRMDGSEVIRCRITHVLASDQPVYQALSYTWGDDTVRYDIELNSKRFQVADNLYWFLYYRSQARITKNSTLLWIDAICINQVDAVEKSCQVQMMGTIYQKAQLVLVWLGCPESEDVEKALEFLNFAERQFGDTSVERKHQELFQDAGYRLLKALGSIFRLPYWSRTWIVQEIVLAPTLVVCCGRRQIAWDALDFWTRNTNSIFTAMGKPPKEPYTPVHRVRAEDLIEIRRVRTHVRILRELPVLLVTYRTTHCHDPRDRVYAFLSLASSPKHTQMIRADYTKSPEELFFDVVKFNFDERRQRTISIPGALVEVLRLPWPEKLNYEDPGEKEKDLFDSDQIFHLSATRLGIVSKVSQQTSSPLVSQSETEPFKYSYFEAEDPPERVSFSERSIEERRRHPADVNSSLRRCKGLANPNVRPGDIVYQFDQVFSGFVARPPQPGEKSSDPLHIVSKAWAAKTTILPNGLLLSDLLAKHISREWNSDKLRISEEGMSDEGHTISLDVGRRELAHVLLEELETWKRGLRIEDCR